MSKKRPLFPSEAFRHDVDRMELDRVETLAADIWDDGICRQDDMANLAYCLWRRKELLNDQFRLTEEGLDRFRIVAGLLAEKTLLVFRNMCRISRDLHERIQSGCGGDFNDFNIEATVSICYDGEESIVDIDDNPGGRDSDYHRFAEILASGKIDGRFPQCLSTDLSYGKDKILGEIEIQGLFAADLDDNFNIDPTWHHWLGKRFPRLLEVPVCHALHNLFHHGAYSLQDIVRINDVWSEVTVTYQNIAP